MTHYPDDNVFQRRYEVTHEKDDTMLNDFSFLVFLPPMLSKGSQMQSKLNRRNAYFTGIVRSSHRVRFSHLLYFRSLKTFKIKVFKFFYFACKRAVRTFLRIKVYGILSSTNRDFYPFTVRRHRPLRWEMNGVSYLLDRAF